MGGGFVFVTGFSSFSRGFGVLHALASGTELFLVLSLRLVLNLIWCTFSRCLSFARFGVIWLSSTGGNKLNSYNKYAADL